MRAHTHTYPRQQRRPVIVVGDKSTVSAIEWCATPSSAQAPWCAAKYASRFSASAASPPLRHYAIKHLLEGTIVLDPTSRMCGVGARASQVRHYTAPPHAAHTPELHNVRQSRLRRRRSFVADSVAHRSAVAAAPRRAQHCHGHHTSTNAGVCVVVRHHGFSQVVLEDVVGQRVVVLGQIRPTVF